jgi:hypothetical protein
MKASNILLIIMLSLFLTVVVASNIALKKEFDKIDKKDPYSGYTQHSLSPFRYVKLQGKSFGVTEITEAEDFKIRFIVDQKYLDWKVVNDTLIVNYSKDFVEGEYIPAQRVYHKPSVYIFVPKLDGLESDNITCSVKGLKSERLQVIQRGNAILLSKNQISDLNAQFSEGVVATIKDENRFGSSRVVVKDSSTFQVDADIFKSLDLEAGDGAHVSVPGSLLRKL